MSSQRNLFDPDPEPWEADEAAEQLVATVVVGQGRLNELDYAVPDGLRGEVEPGRRVRVPLGKGNRLVEAYCVAVETRPAGTRRLKPVEAVLDPRRLLSAHMIRLAQWIAEYYLCDLATVMETILPAGVRTRAGTRKTTLLSLAPDAKEKLKTLKVTPKQMAVLKLLARSAEPLAPQDLCRQARCTLAPIQVLRKHGLLHAQIARVQLPPMRATPVAERPKERHLELNADQRQALQPILAAMNAREHRTVLIRGVTGSGKTEVYIQAIQEVIDFGRQAIVLVPEISLTPQTVERFRSRFGEVAVLHSHLTDAERHWHWQRIAAGHVQVIVGARSAVFAPTPHLGIIVLDEEHEPSFKQDSSPRYHARDVALVRARAEAVPLVLGSATPSLESWQRAATGEFTLVEMPRRVFDRPLPDVGTIDLRMEKLAGAMAGGAIGRQLQRAMEVALGEGGQVILLLNRRGYSTHIQCPACGHAVHCPNCDIALTHHREMNRALCHYCDYEIPAPLKCPKCAFAGIRYSGLGTQRLEAEVRARFPDAACLRMDTDSMQARDAHEKALQAFREGKVQILLGTQMIAKGLDFPNVTLVGVVNADTALHLPDFRASERTFQLVTQVAGRTGRGPRGGRVIVQTFSPDHPAIRAAVHHDYIAFANGELPLRKLLRYPPFASMVRIVMRGPTQVNVQTFAQELASRLKQQFAAEKLDGRVLGPAPAPFVRLRGMYRLQIQLQAADGPALRKIVYDVTREIKAPDEVQWIADVDPIDMM